MTRHHGPEVGPGDRTLLGFFGAIASRDRAEVARRLSSPPELATRRTRVGATRQDPELFVAMGADVCARNRRGAEPPHYAADGGPDTGHWDPLAQRDVIMGLVAAGADPNALDRGGVAPLHRAIRNRCSAAARALIAHRADPWAKNARGSTPWHLAVQNTGKSHSGSEASHREQRLIIALLREHGASVTDAGGAGEVP